MGDVSQVKITGRIEYIDRIKGFTILTVIMGHVLNLSFGHASLSSLFNFICAFHMPLFIFISGYVIKSIPDAKKCVKRTMQYLLPAITIGLIYTLWSSYSVTDFFTHSFKRGYWFLFVLCYYNWFLFIGDKIVRLNNQLCKELLIGGGILLILVLLNRITEQSINATFSIRFVRLYWIFFYCGFIFRKYDLFNTKLLSSNHSFTISFFIFILLFIMTEKHIQFPFQDPLKSMMGIIFFFLLIKDIHSKGYIEKTWNLIGNNTLDIYIYHYFFISLLSIEGATIGISHWFNNLKSPLVEFIVVITLSLIIAIFSVITGRLVKRSNILCKVVYWK